LLLYHGPLEWLVWRPMWLLPCLNTAYAAVFLQVPSRALLCRRAPLLLPVWQSLAEVGRERHGTCVHAERWPRAEVFVGARDGAGLLRCMAGMDSV
jgi:hypothetical protein